MKPLRESKPEELRPDIRQFFDLFKGPIDVRSVALTGIFLLLILYSLYFARDVFLPLVLAYVLSALLAPVVRFLRQIYIPEVLGAGLILLVVLGLGTYGAYRLSGPAIQWIQQLPKNLDEIRLKLRALTRPVEQARETTKRIERMTSGGAKEATPRQPGEV